MPGFAVVTANTAISMLYQRMFAALPLVLALATCQPSTSSPVDDTPAQTPTAVVTRDVMGVESMTDIFIVERTSGREFAAWAYLELEGRAVELPAGSQVAVFGAVGPWVEVRTVLGQVAFVRDGALDFGQPPPVGSDLVAPATSATRQDLRRPCLATTISRDGATVETVRYEYDSPLNLVAAFRSEEPRSPVGASDYFVHDAGGCLAYEATRAPTVLNDINGYEVTPAALGAAFAKHAYECENGVPSRRRTLLQGSEPASFRQYMYTGEELAWTETTFASGAATARVGYVYTDESPPTCSNLDHLGIFSGCPVFAAMRTGSDGEVLPVMRLRYADDGALRSVEFPNGDGGATEYEHSSACAAPAGRGLMSGLPERDPEYLWPESRVELRNESGVLFGAGDPAALYLMLGGFAGDEVVSRALELNGRLTSLNDGTRGRVVLVRRHAVLVAIDGGDQDGHEFWLPVDWVHQARRGRRSSSRRRCRTEFVANGAMAVEVCDD